LAVQVDQAQVTILVRDNGIGIEAAFLARIFDLFSQAHRSADRAQGGLGIGMALVRSLVDLHQGSILAESRGQGQGSTFTVRLPRFCAAELPQPMPERGANHVRGSRQKVMVVDDNVDAAEVLAMYLESSGHEVIVEHAPRAALARASVEHPTVFLLDIGLPEMDGNELASRLRALPEFAKACLIAVTGYGQEQDRQSTAAAGFDHHFVKPVDMAALTALLEALGDANPAPV
jgi:CheY-like chemotaxis protein